MAYVISKSNGTVLGIVEDQTSDSSLCSVTLIGKAFKHYGQAFNDNLVAIIENFSNTTPPPNAMSGQLWYNSSTQQISYYDGTNWILIASGNSINSSDFATVAQLNQTNSIIETAMLSSGFNPDGSRPNYASTHYINNSQNLVEAISTLDNIVGNIYITASGYLTVSQAQALYAPINSPSLTGTPTAPTPPAGDNSNKIATTAFVQNVISSETASYLTATQADNLYAPINSPSLTGTPTAPTPPAGDNSNKIATTAFVFENVQSYSTGNYITVAEAEATYAPISTPKLTGIPTAPTPPSNNNSNIIATTAFVSNFVVSNFLTSVQASQIYAPINSPNLLGIPTAPTPAAGDNSNKIATTAFITNYIENLPYVFLTGEQAQNEFILIDSPVFTAIPTVPTANTGTSTNQIASTAFATGTLDASNQGYQILPSGLIIQWGSGAINASGGAPETCLITLPIPFPNACVCTFANEANPGGAWLANQHPTIYSAEIISKSQINVYGFIWNSEQWVVSQGISFYWMALGF